MTTQKPKRQARSDSAAALLQAAQNVAAELAEGVLRPPAHVQISTEAEPYYRDIVRARAREEWNPHQLTIAAQLAQCMVDQEDVAAELVLEGRVIVNAKGTKVANPLVSIQEQLARRQMALGRSLQMVGRALGDPRKPGGPRALEENARRLAGQVGAEGGQPVPAGADDDDDYLAR